MNHMFARFLCALLIGALLLAPVGLAEGEPVGEAPAAESVIVDEPADEIAVEAVASEAVEEAVAEAADVELAEDSAFEARSVEGELTETDQSESMLDGSGEGHTGAYQLRVSSSSSGTGNGGSTGADIDFRAYFGDALVHDSADSGDVINLRYNTSSGFRLTRIVLEYEGKSVEIDIANPVFTMPAANATVTGYFIASEQIIPIDEAHFPDAAFRQYISENVDRGNGGPDGILSDSEIAEIHGFVLTGKGIKDLTGIKYFTNLQRLYVSGSNITGTSSDGLISLDVSGMPNLVKVYCACNQLTALDFSNCPNLVEMTCYTNKLTSLAIENCPKLEVLHCHNNKLTSLVFVDNCPNLKVLSCNENKLSSLDLSNQPEFVARWKSWKYKIKSKTSTWYAIRRANPPEAFEHDNKTRIITASVPAVPAAFADVPGAVAAQVTVAAGSTAKNTRATVVAAPGAKTQLDLSGATGKSFKSSNKKVATVTKGGVITFKKAGKVKITYKVGKKTRKVTLTVTDPTLPTAVAFESVNTDVKAGESVTLTPTVNEGANPGGYKWKSSNKKVAAVKNGVVTFKKAGKVTVTCTTKRGKKKAKVTFTVSQ